MDLNFNINSVTVTEFGVGRDDGDAKAYVAVPVDSAVQKALQKMVAATWETMRTDEDGPVKYEPSEKHGTSEYLYLPLGDAMAASVKGLHDAVNLALDSAALDDDATMFCYFVRLTDKNGRRLTGLRRATQFKGVLKSRLLRFISDSLKLVEDRVFKLDIDFDLLIDSTTVHILRPSGFEFLGRLQEEILKAVPQNVAAVRKDLPFVEFGSIQDYASKHPRAARYLASIQGQKETENIDKDALKKFCRRNGVVVKDSNGKLTIDIGHAMGFLKVLDRRLYEVDIVKGPPEHYEAASRKKIVEAS